MRKFLMYAVVCLLVLFSIASFAQVNVTVNTPQNGSTVSSPVNVRASATSSHPITGWRIYVDDQDVFSAVNVPDISANLNMSAGSHAVVVRAWDSTGIFGSSWFTINVSSSASSAPVPPSNAVMFSNIEDASGWNKCSSGSCSGGASSTSNYWFGQYQTQPSIDGASTQFYIDGSPYATDLFWKKLGAQDQFSHFIYDFYVFFDTWSSIAATEALEFDIFQVVGGHKYMFGTECNYWLQKWDVWNEYTQRWVHTDSLCTKFSPGAWHHVSWRVDRLSGQTHYLSVTVDGVTRPINSAYAYQPAPGTWWSDVLGVQVQQDLSSNPGSGIHEWIDKMSVWAW